MKTLVIGNGFDLEHGLPTRYTDFLDYLSLAYKIHVDCNGETILSGPNKADKFSKSTDHIKNDNKISQSLKIYILDHLNKEENVCFSENVRKLFSKEDGENNLWYEYFFKVVKDNTVNGINWVDFEEEIAKVVRKMEVNDKNKLVIFPGYQYAFTNIDTFMKRKERIPDEFLKRDIIKRLENELSDFINALDDYISLVDRLPVIYQSPSIDSNFNNVISFNYSDVYRHIYNPMLPDANIHFIHGKAGEGKNEISSNLVLGTEETLDDKMASANLDCLKFKKYYQRIYKRTGMRYKKFINAVKPGEKREIIFFGHSLAITDSDVIRELIDNYDKVTIFYHDDQQYREQIANLVLILGKDKLIGYAEDKLEFVKQHDRIKAIL